MSAQGSTDKQVMQVPRIAWPTIALFAAALALWGGVVWSVHIGDLAMGWGTLGATLALYLIFTPLHDAAHKSASSIPWVNEALGRVCGWLYFGFFGGFRHVHLEHHKHTNDPDHDPDHWVALGPTWALPLRWLTLDLRYHYVHARQWRRQPRPHQVEAVITGLVLTALLVALVASGWGWEVLWLWLVPLKLAFASLAYAFDYLPHTPHRVLASVDRYQATNVRPHPLLSVVMVWQNLHLVHHLYPAVPFYRYRRVWRARREALLAQGVSVRSLTGRVVDNSEVKPGLHRPPEGGPSMA